MGHSNEAHTGVGKWCGSTQDFVWPSTSTWREGGSHLKTVFEYFDIISSVDKNT